MATTASDQLRVLLRTATAKDAAITVPLLERAGVAAQVCRTAAELAHEIADSAGAVLIAEEMLADPEIAGVTQALQAQPPWSDLPVVVLARTGADSQVIAQAMDLWSNVTVIERPMRVSSLVSALRSALAARRRQYELRSVMEGLHESDQRKTEFLATLAHELRNPLAPLGTTLAILMRADFKPQEARPYYEMMGRQVSHMVRLIDDLMEVSRITRGKIELRPHPLALDQVVRDAVELSRPLIDGAKHQLVVNIGPGDWTVCADGVRLTQVFSNLLNNAAKYTPAGGCIEISVERHGGAARVCVRDNGLGIDPAMLHAVFDMFVQVTSTSRAAQGGLGIGLTLVKSLVELQGGTVEAHSEGLGKGTSFTVELPLAPRASVESEKSPCAADELDVFSGNILVVDDNRDAADSLCALLETMGASTTVAYDAVEALRLVALRKPSIAILDIGMPGMDGYELAQRLRKDPLCRDMALVALTGWGQPEHRERIAAAGFNHHLVKPVDIGELAGVVSRLRAAA